MAKYSWFSWLSPGTKNIFVTTKIGYEDINQLNHEYLLNHEYFDSRKLPAIMASHVKEKVWKPLQLDTKTLTN